MLIDVTRKVKCCLAVAIDWYLFYLAAASFLLLFSTSRQCSERAVRVSLVVVVVSLTAFANCKYCAVGTRNGKGLVNVHCATIRTLTFRKQQRVFCAVCWPECEVIFAFYAINAASAAESTRLLVVSLKKGSSSRLKAIWAAARALLSHQKHLQTSNLTQAHAFLCLAAFFIYNAMFLAVPFTIDIYLACSLPSNSLSLWWGERKCEAN